MTKQVRDWQKDMEMDSPIGYSPPESMEHPIIAMLKQQYEAEKERVDRLREEMEWIRERAELALDGDRDDNYGLAVALTAVRQKAHECIYHLEKEKTGNERLELR